MLTSLTLLLGTFMRCANALNIIPDFYLQTGSIGSCDQVISDTANAYIRSHAGAYLLPNINFIGYDTNVDCSVEFNAGLGKFEFQDIFKSFGLIGRQKVINH